MDKGLRQKPAIPRQARDSLEIGKVFFYTCACKIPAIYKFYFKRKNNPRSNCFFSIIDYLCIQ